MPKEIMSRAVPHEGFEDAEELPKKKTLLERMRTHIGRKVTAATALLALSGGVRAGVEHYKSHEALKGRVAELEKNAGHMPEINQRAIVMRSEESGTEQKESAHVFERLLASFKKHFNSGFSIVEEEGRAHGGDMRFVVAAFEPQLAQWVDVSKIEAASAKAHKMEGREFRFLTSTLRDGLFEQGIAVGGIGDVFYKTQHNLKFDDHKEWYVRQFNTTAGFVQRVYEDHLAGLPEESQEAFRAPLARYIGSELEVRVDSVRLRDAIGQEDVDVLNGYKDHWGKEHSGIVKKYLAAVENRNKALLSFHDALKKLGVTGPVEKQTALAYNNLQDKFELQDALLEKLDAVSSRATRTDADALLSLLDRVQSDIAKYQLTFEKLENHTASAD